MSETDVRQASDRFYQALQGVLAGDPPDGGDLVSLG